MFVFSVFFGVCLFIVLLFVDLGICSVLSWLLYCWIVCYDSGWLFSVGWLSLIGWFDLFGLRLVIWCC